MTSPATPVDVRVRAMAEARGLILGRLSDACLEEDGLPPASDARYVVIGPVVPADRVRFGPATLADCERWLDTP